MNRRQKSVSFEIPYVQLLAPDGQLTGPAPPCASRPEELRAMYRMMVRARLFDTKAVNLQRTGKLGTYPSCLGHEATHVALGAAMQPDDVLFPVYREIGTKFWRGVEMRDVLLYWGGDERGTYYRNDKYDFPWCVPIASQMPQAAGAALAFKLRGETRCAVGMIGDGGTSQGAFYEAINLAGAKQLPLITVVVNNRWAISVPIAEQTAAETLAQKAVAAGIRGVQVDGNDFLAAREVFGAALARARAGGGPTVIEALTYRLSDHTTSDDATRYRSAEEVEQARAEEPFIRTRKYLEARGLWSEKEEQQWRTKCSADIEQAVRDYQSTARQSTDSMFDYVYAKLPANLDAQRELARRHAGRH